MTTWEQDYEALLARVKGPGLVEPARAAKMSGLELLQGIASGSVPFPPINQTLDFYLLEKVDSLHCPPGLHPYYSCDERQGAFPVIWPPSPMSPSYPQTLELWCVIQEFLTSRNEVEMQ